MNTVQFLLALFLIIYLGILLLFGLHMWLYRQGRKQIDAQNDFLLQVWRKPWL